MSSNVRSDEYAHRCRPLPAGVYTAADVTRPRPPAVRRVLGPEPAAALSIMATDRDNGKWLSVGNSCWPLSDQLSKNLTQHIWAISRAAARKYQLVGRAIVLLAGAMLVGTLGLLLP
jgi:hypothetical protein